MLCSELAEPGILPYLFTLLRGWLSKMLLARINTPTPAEGDHE
jgi:hypothetical protein